MVKRYAYKIYCSITFAPIWSWFPPCNKYWNDTGIFYIELYIELQILKMWTKELPWFGDRKLTTHWIKIVLPSQIMREHTMFMNHEKLYLKLHFILTAVNDMPPRKRSVNIDGSPKVYVDIDDISWRIKSEVEDEAEPSGVPRSPGKSPYSLRNSPRIPQIVPSEEEVIN